MRELGACLHLDVGRQSAQYIIEQRNLIIGIAARAGRKQVGDPINDPEAVLGGRGGDRTDKLIEERATFGKRGCCVGRGVHCHGSSLQINEIQAVPDQFPRPERVGRYRKDAKTSCTSPVKKIEKF